MNGKRLLPLLASLALAALVSACIQKNTGDEPSTTSDIPAGLNRFLLFPNPVAMSAGGFETNTSDYADAYYRAIDPNGKRTTLADWMAENGFTGSRTPKAGSEHLVVFRDTRDLGYGRRMTGRRNSVDGSIAFFVENYNVVPNSSADYSSVLNVEAAIQRDARWHVGTNAIEWSVGECSTAEVAIEGCDGTVMFAKFYNFSAQDGTRQLAVDLDGKGLKAMPGPCITCHGGRGDPLTPGEGNPSKPRFPLVENSLSRKRGDVQARLHGMNVGSFGFSARAGFTREAQEASLRDFNQWILCTYPVPGGAVVSGVCTLPTAGLNEWQGTAAEIIQSWYGASTPLLQGSFSDNPPHVPAGWSGNPTLYTDVVAPFCRTCHILRGTANQNDIDFNSLAKFLSYADRIKAHVFDRGTMPLALIVYNDFWSSDAPRQLANAINPSLAALTPPQTATDSTGAALKPGRPIANPGPSRMVKTNAPATLSGENSLFATSWHWERVSGGAVTFANPNAMITSFTVPSTGDVTVRLTVSNGTLKDQKDITITANDAFPDPATLKFAHVKNVLQNISHTTAQATGKCTDCHKDVGAPAPVATPPVWYTNFDRNGNGGAADDTDDAWFLKGVQGRVNLTEIDASPLLRRPTGNHHNGKMLLDVADKVNGGLRDYSVLYNWILAGMPAGGVAASPVVNGGVDPAVVAFSGSFPGPYTSPSITMDGSSSIAPTGVTLTYAWSIVSQPVGGNAVITNPNTVNPTITVQNVGDYVVQLQVSGGGLTDTTQRRFTVNETPFTTDFTPADGGSGAVTFSGGRGDLVLTSVTSAFSTVPSNPVSCSWTVISGPGVVSPGVGALGGPLLDGSSNLVSTKPCIGFVTFCIFGSCFNIPVFASANLNVASSALNQQYVVDFTASTVTSQTVTHTITVAENPPVPSITVNPPTSVSFSNDIFGRPFASISLSGSSTGVTPFQSITWSIDSAPAGAVVGSSITSGSMTSTLTARATGQYTVRLAVTDNAGGIGAATSTFTVSPSLGTTFGTMANDFVSFGCTASCHVAANGEPGVGQGIAPSWVTDGTNGGNVALWQRVFARVILGASVNNSLLLLNPSNTDPAGHGGGCRPGFNTLGNAANVSPNFCPDTSSANYTAFRNWIVNGAPPGN